MMARVRRVIEEGTAHYERLLEDRGVELVRAPARFVSANELEARDLRLPFTHALVATGLTPPAGSTCPAPPRCRP